MDTPPAGKFGLREAALVSLIATLLSLLTPLTRLLSALGHTGNGSTWFAGLVLALVTATPQPLFLWMLFRSPQPVRIDDVFRRPSQVLCGLLTVLAMVTLPQIVFEWMAAQSVLPSTTTVLASAPKGMAAVTWWLQAALRVFGDFAMAGLYLAFATSAGRHLEGYAPIQRRLRQSAQLTLIIGLLFMVLAAINLGSLPMLYSRFRDAVGTTDSPLIVPFPIAVLHGLERMVIAASLAGAPFFLLASQPKQTEEAAVAAPREDGI